MINSGGLSLFAPKTLWQSSQDKLAHSFVVRAIFSCFYIFHNDSVIFFSKKNLVAGREILGTAAYSAGVQNRKKQTFC